jgi:hypothetical protein
MTMRATPQRMHLMSGHFFQRACCAHSQAADERGSTAPVLR